MRSAEEILAQLAQSKFRARIHLNAAERRYLARRGLETVLQDAARFIEERLAAANPAGDGRQTPWHNHPAFVAQHATATCCRGCLQKWHGMAKGNPLGQ